MFALNRSGNDVKLKPHGAELRDASYHTALYRWAGLQSLESGGLESGGCMLQKCCTIAEVTREKEEGSCDIASSTNAIFWLQVAYL
jgi:hypothetical protein